MNASEKPASGSSKQNEEILKSLRHLNSCITLTSVKEGNSGSRSPSPSDSGASSEEDSQEDRRIPSALRGISIQGASGRGTLISSLLNKSKSEESKSKDLGSSSASSTATRVASNLQALRGVSIQGVKSQGGESIKDLIEKAREQNRESAAKSKNSPATIPTLRGVSIQGITTNNSKSEDEDSEDSNSSDRTPASAKKNLPNFPGVSIQVNPKGQAEDENSSSNSSSAPSSPGVPSALRGLSIQGASKESILNNILGKSKENDKNTKDSQSKFLNEWSKRCLSISFSSQNKDSDDEAPVNDQLRNGSPSSAANSASNSRDSFPKKQEFTSSPKNRVNSEDPTKTPPNSTLTEKKISDKLVEESSYKEKPALQDKEKPVIKEQEEQKFESTKEPIVQEKETPVIEKEPSKVLEKEILSKVSEVAVPKVQEQSKPVVEKEKLKNTEPETSPLHCHICSTVFQSRIALLNHIQICPNLSKPSTSKTPPGIIKTAVARKKTIQRYSPGPATERECIHCGIFSFRSYLAFEEHHAAHIKGSQLRVYIKRCSSQIQRYNNLEESEDSDHSLESNSGGGVAEVSKAGSEDRSLKLTFKISQQQKRGRGRKKKRVEIINNQDMSEGSPSFAGETQEGSAGVEDNSVNQSSQLSPLEENHTENRRASSDLDSDASSQASSFAGFDTNLGFNTAETTNERPPSTYQPQFESYTGDWFNEFESGSRIAAAMTGSNAEGADQTSSNTYSSVAEAPNSNTYGSNGNKDLHSSSNGDGLFSQAVLGSGEGPENNDQRQGSFEQLCLNDSYGHTQPNETQSLPPNYQDSQQYHSSQGQSGTDLLTELAYLNNPGHQSLDAMRTSPHDAENAFNSRGSNSGTPTSAGHPTPPPMDSSFRALATSPLHSPGSPMNSGLPTPPIQGSTPPMPHSTSPLQQMSQMGNLPSDSVSAPRLTIANNLMATTANNSSPQVNNYGQQWATPSNSQQNFSANYLPPSMAGNLANVRPNAYAGMPVGYKPSPPARLRGRPPLIGHVNRPGMIRGPGRPPGSTGLPTLMPAGGRGGMVPNMRQPQFVSNRGGVMGGQKRTQSQSLQSPNKTMRREDINVPSRQKDNECQIIAVANRTEGMPVIANIQGREERSKATAPSDSTIHLSDSITLSVRPNQVASRDAGRGEKGGDAGVVANLLASRGITVTPAAGEKESGSSREERRLPTASDLNLSSAISVHPPTSRDRDGFLVPNSPATSSRSSGAGGGANSQLDRPPRPPTVDLTQEISNSGSPATRLQCSQCERTFPTQSLLSDHAKVHQQQAQSRMPHKCHLCTAGFSTQKGQQHHYQNFHQLHLSAGDLAIPVVDFRNPINVQRLAQLGIRSFLPLSNLQNRGAGGIVGIPILTVENVQNGQMNMQKWGITDILTLGPAKTLNPPR